MMRNPKKTINTLLLIGLLTLSPLIWAQSSTSQKVKNIFYCPAIQSIKKNNKTLNWYAPGGYKSYETSFASKVTSFLGAQWVGANVGQITCVYHSQQHSTFPILLVFHTLTYQPKSGRWSKNLGGYFNCKSHKQKDCPFSVRLQSKPKDLYQEIEKLKTDPNF